MKQKTLKDSKIKLYSLLFIVFTVFAVITASACSVNSIYTETNNGQPQQTNGMKHYDGYTLDQMTVFSRHNIRAAVTSGVPSYDKLTPHKWVDWTANAGELTLRGGDLETMMGQYFRKYLESEHLIPENWIPQGDEAYIYSNSYQRTIATAQFFASGLLPVASPQVNHKYSVGENDPIFKKGLTLNSEKFKNQVLKEIKEYGGQDAFDNIEPNLSENFKILEKVLDFKDSEYAKEKGLTEFKTDDLKVEFKEGKRPVISGSLSIGSTAVDALKLQYYMTENDEQAAFGEKISYQDWEKLGEIDDMNHILYSGTHTTAIDLAHPLLMELQNQMKNTNRKFTFICGHDTNILPIVTALGVHEYRLPNAISKLTPIGSKLVFNKWKNTSGEEYCSVSIVYNSVSQLRHLSVIDENYPPMEYTLELDGLQKNKDGLYKYSDVMERFSQAINEYNSY